MALRQPNFYNLRKGAVFDDLFSMDFIDILWQVFEKDKLESITIELSKLEEQIKMRVVEVKKKAREP
jgi:hypothetical protein